MQIWRSAGWPCKDAIEIDLLAAQLLRLDISDDGRETLRLTDAGIALLAETRQRNQRALSGHDRLAQKLAEQLIAGGRVVWRELSLRAQVENEQALAGVLAAHEKAPLWVDEPDPPAAVRNVWRMARPDVFSVRNTSVEAYLQPVVHEVKFSRADLLSDLRHAAKRQAYQWLCCEAYYVFPVAIAKPEEIPLNFGVVVLHGTVDDGQFEVLRPARHVSCTLPFAVWLSLAKATPMRVDASEAETAQAVLSPAP